MANAYHNVNNILSVLSSARKMITKNHRLKQWLFSKFYNEMNVLSAWRLNNFIYNEPDQSI